MTTHIGLDSVKRSYLLRNNSSHISLWKLYELTWFAQNLDLVQEVFEHLDSKLIATPVGRQIKKRLVASKPLLTGNIFPALLLKDSAGNQINLRRKIAAKFTLIDFWFTNCRPCLGQFPDLKRIYQKFIGSGFDIIGITIDKKDKMQTWRRLLQEKT